METAGSNHPSGRIYLLWSAYLRICTRSLAGVKSGVSKKNDANHRMPADSWLPDSVLVTGAYLNQSSVP